MKAKNTSSGGNAQSFFKTHPRVCGLLLAGTKGSRLFPMTSADMPKHLLPVAGIPSILRLIQSLGNFPELVIAVNHEDNLTLAALVKEACTLKDNTEDVWTLEYTSTKQKITLLKLSEECFGSADALRQVEAKKIVHVKTRIVVIPGDLVILKRDINLDALIRPSDDDACTTLLVDVGEVDDNGVPLKESAKVLSHCMLLESCFGTQSLTVFYFYARQRKEGLHATTKTLNILDFRIPRSRPAACVRPHCPVSY